MDISIVIASKDRAGALERTLASLWGQHDASAYEAVVVDNGSADDTREMVARCAAGAAFPVRYVYEPQPNRGKARNRGVAAAQGALIAFCDDDVQLPPGWIAAHVAGHRTRTDAVVNGPIVNVPSYERQPRAGLVNYSRAFLCTCNVSVRKRTFERVGGFDETFDLYGWEDTELGVRLREAGVEWAFAWDAFLWHVKPPAENTIEVETRKAVEKARMAGRFVAKHPSRRARLATGAHALNVLRGRYCLPESLLAMCAGVASSERVPVWARSIARMQLLDAIYTRELIRTLDRG